MKNHQKIEIVVLNNGSLQVRSVIPIGEGRTLAQCMLNAGVFSAQEIEVIKRQLLPDHYQERYWIEMQTILEIARNEKEGNHGKEDSDDR